MSEQPNQSINPNHGETAAQQDLTYFLETVGAVPGAEQLDRYQLRAVAETMVWLKVEPQKTGEETRDLKGEYEQALRSADKPFFLPASLSEAQAVIASPEKRLRKAVSYDRATLKAAKPTFSQMQGHLREAETELKLINRTMVGSEAQGIKPDAEAARSSPQLLFLLSERLMQRTFLANGKWPRRDTKQYKQLRSYNRGALEGAARWGSDGFWEKLLDMERRDIRARYSYWKQEVGSLAQTPGGVAVKSALAEQDRPQLTTAAVSEPPPEPEEKLSRPEFSMPPAVKAAQRVKYESHHHRISTLVEQGWSPLAAELSVLGGKAIRDEEGYVTGVELSGDQPGAEKLAKWEADRKTRFAKRRRPR